MGEGGSLSSAFKFQIILLLLAKIIEILVRKHFFTCCRCFIVVVVFFVVVAFSACKSLIINFLINFYTAGKLLQRVSMRQVFRLWINVILFYLCFFFLHSTFIFIFIFFSRCSCCVCVFVTPPRAVCLTGASKFDEFLNLKSLFVHF